MKIKYQKQFNLSIDKMKEATELINSFEELIPEDDDNVPIIGSGFIIRGVKRKDAFIVKDIIQTRP